MSATRLGPGSTEETVIRIVDQTERSGDFDGFARGCCFERELAQKAAKHSHDRRHETRTKPEVWFSQN